MCGRFAFFDSGNFSDRFMVDEAQLDFEADYNIAPGAMSPIVVRNSPNSVKKAKWGLIPSWSKEFKMSFSTFNARVEGIEKSRLFGPLLIKKRCLIPANGFYEWTHNNGKTPHYIHITDNKVFAFAGLYDIWQDAEDLKHYSFTIITTAANPFIEKIHKRMPVILKPGDEQVWLDANLTDKAKIFEMLDQYNSKYMDEHIVSDQVNNARNNFADLIDSV